MHERDDTIIEEMDDPSSDVIKLENTYRQFSRINQILSRWKLVYKKYLKPIMKESSSPTLLDIGFGGGDVVLSILGWARKDGIDLKITGIETDQRAIDFVNKNVFQDSNLDFKFASVEDLIKDNLVFDIVISNHVLHHLPTSEIKTFLGNSSQLARKLVLHNDLERSMLAYYLFYPSKLIFKNSYIFEDGLSSIKRAFTPAELEKIGGLTWKVKKVFPFRQVVYQFNNNDIIQK